jgi:hypothetical protein
MIDPFTTGFIELEQALGRFAAEIPEREAEDQQKNRLEQFKQALRGSYEDPPTLAAEMQWMKRETAIAQIYLALCDGNLIALVRDPDSGALIRLIGADWRTAALWRDIIVGGVVRTATGEEIARHDGRRVLLEACAFDAWLKAQIRPRAQPAKVACQEWLEAAMREAPNRGPNRKGEWRTDAKAKFNVSGRAFDQLWATALQITGANWDRHGAPPKLPR